MKVVFRPFGKGTWASKDVYVSEHNKQMWFWIFSNAVEPGLRYLVHQYNSSIRLGS